MAGGPGKHHPDRGRRVPPATGAAQPLRLSHLAQGGRRHHTGPRTRTRPRLGGSAEVVDHGYRTRVLPSHALYESLVDVEAHADAVLDTTVLTAPRLEHLGPPSPPPETLPI